MLWCFVPQMHGHFEGDMENHTSWCIHFSSSFEFVFTHQHPTWKQNNIAILSFPYQSCSTAIGVVPTKKEEKKTNKNPNFLSKEKKKKGESTQLYSHVERKFFSPPHLTGKVYSRKMSILLTWIRKLFLSAYHQKVRKSSHCIFHNINAVFQTLWWIFFICHICHSEDKPENKCFFCFFSLSLQQSSLVLWGRHSLPEEDVPEKQPARVDQ